MDEAVIKYYRKLLRDGFVHAGSFDNPSIILDTESEGLRFCRRPTGQIQIFINVINGRIDGIKYLCNCEPTANVAVEALCELVKGRTLEEAATTREESFLTTIGSSGEELRKKAVGLLELLNRGIVRYKLQCQSEQASNGVHVTGG